MCTPVLYWIQKPHQSPGPARADDQELCRNVDISGTFVNEPDIVDFGYVDPGPMMGMDRLFGAMPIILVVFLVVFVAVLGFMAWVFVRNFRAGRKAGLDPFTLQTELAARAANSRLLAPRQNREHHLAELDDLLARQVITRDEYNKARLKILAEE